MAPVVEIISTQELLDVSQGTHSSPNVLDKHAPAKGHISALGKYKAPMPSSLHKSRSSKAAPASQRSENTQDREDVQLVKDSLSVQLFRDSLQAADTDPRDKSTVSTTRPNYVGLQPGASENEDAEDDLYCVTPKAKRTSKQRAGTNKATASRQLGDAHLEHGSAADSDARNGKEGLHRQKARDPPEANKVMAYSALDQPRTRIREKVQIADAGHRSPSTVRAPSKPATAGDGGEKPSASVDRRSGQHNAVKNEKKSAAIRPTSTTDHSGLETAQAVPGGAFAALRARRAGLNGATPARSKPSPTMEREAPDQQPRAINTTANEVQTPALHNRAEQPHGLPKRPQQGRAGGQKSGRIAATSRAVSLTTFTTPPAPKRKFSAATKSGNPELNEARNDVPDHAQHVDVPDPDEVGPKRGRSTKLKRATETQPVHNDGADAGAGLLQVAEPRVAERQPKRLRMAEKSWVGEEAAALQKPMPTPKPTARGRKGGLDNTRTISFAPGNAVPATHRRRAGSSMPETSRCPNVRTRMMARSDAEKVAELPPPSTMSNEAAVKSAPDRKQRKNVRTEVAAETANEETFDAFEQSVVNFGGFDEASGIVAPRSPNMTTATAVHEFLGKALRKQQPLAGTEALANVAIQDGQPLQGASQQNAIILSDRQELSSPARSTAESKARQDVVSIPHGVQRSDHQPPKTPMAFRSSPPQAGTVLDHTTGVQASRSAARPSIINFGKTGPLNQGMASVKKSAPVPVGASSALRDRVISRATPRAYDRPRPKAGYTPGLKARDVTNESPEDVTDVLAGFTKTSTTKHRPTLGQSAVVQETPRNDLVSFEHSSVINDNGFTLHHNEGSFVTEDTILLATEEGFPLRNDFVSSPELHDMTDLVSNRRQGAPEVPSLELQAMRTDIDLIENEVSKNMKRKAPGTAAMPGVDGGQSATLDVSSSRSAIAMAFGSHSQLLGKKQRSPLKTGDLPQQSPKHGGRGPSRNASYGSQTVDVYGSPVPHGMTAPGMITVLEKYSQSAPLSPDLADVTTPPHKKRRAVTVGDAQVPQRLNDVFVRDHGPLLGNVKRVPSGPQEDTKAVTGFAKMELRSPLVQYTERSQQTDPFEIVTDSNARASSSSGFIQKLRKLISGEDTVSRQRKAWHKVTIDDDPDKTLVAEASPLHIASDARLEPSLGSPSTASSTSHSTASHQQDLGLWRHALEPHQMNLFDELVNVSHRLMQHLIDSERATTHIIEDFRIRGEQLVKHLDTTQVSQLAAYKEAFGVRTDRVRHGIGDCNASITKCVQSVKSMHRSECISDEKLKGVMERYC